MIETNEKGGIIDHLLSLSIGDQHKRLVELSKDHQWAKDILEGK